MMFIHLLAINLAFSEKRLVYAFINENEERDERECEN